jgi:osmotically-inducible protein OsmY
MTSSRQISRRALLASAAALAAGSLSGCVPLIVGGAAATATVVSDRRSVQEQANDKNINANVNAALKAQFGDGTAQTGDTARINCNTFLGVVLLTGDVYSEKAKAQATDIAAKIAGVKSVSNQIHVGPLGTFGDDASDTWLTSKVMAKLASTYDVPSRAIVVTSHLGVVYLMGMVTQHEGDLAAAAAAEVSGVRRVDKLFRTITPAEAARLDNINNKMPTLSQGSSSGKGESSALGEATPSQAPAAGTPGTGGAVEVMPIK